MTREPVMLAQGAGAIQPIKRSPNPRSWFRGGAKEAAVRVGGGGRGAMSLLLSPSGLETLNVKRF
ncbi:MAG: hypothetical protein ACFB2Z_05815 [Maricaulaceae bacterium]